MHSCLRLVVKAPSEPDAVREAQAAFDYSLRSYEDAGNGVDGPFDRAKPMNTEDRRSGANRWSKYLNEPLAFELVTTRGQEELESAWNDTVEGIITNLKNIQETLTEKTKKEVLDDWSIREQMGELHPDRPGPVYHLYDGTAAGPHLLPVTTTDDWECLCDRIAEEFWIVPMDAHF